MRILRLRDAGSAPNFEPDQVGSIDRICTRCYASAVAPVRARANGDDSGGDSQLPLNIEESRLEIRECTRIDSEAKDGRSTRSRKRGSGFCCGEVQLSAIGASWTRGARLRRPRGARQSLDVVRRRCRAVKEHLRAPRPAYARTNAILERFRERFGTTQCGDLTASGSITSLIQIGHTCAASWYSSPWTNSHRLPPMTRSRLGGKKPGGTTT